MSTFQPSPGATEAEAKLQKAGYEIIVALQDLTDDERVQVLTRIGDLYGGFEIRQRPHSFACPNCEAEISALDGDGVAIASCLACGWHGQPEETLYVERNHDKCASCGHRRGNHIGEQCWFDLCPCKAFVENSSNEGKS